MNDAQRSVSPEIKRRQSFVSTPEFPDRKDAKSFKFADTPYSAHLIRSKQMAKKLNENRQPCHPTPPTVGSADSKRYQAQLRPPEQMVKVKGADNRPRGHPPPVFGNAESTTSSEFTQQDVDKALLLLKLVSKKSQMNAQNDLSSDLVSDSSSDICRAIDRGVDAFFALGLMFLAVFIAGTYFPLTSR
jgi:hypothetical protein